MKQALRHTMSIIALAGLLVLGTPPQPAAAEPTIGPCTVFPADNPWNTDISGAAIHPNSANYIANINANGGDYVHPDFGEDPTYGIPYITVTGTQAKVPVTFDYDDESDPGPYPIPPNAPVEGGGDRHVLVIETTNCILYEMYASEYVGGAQQAWEAGSGAIFNLNSNALRPDGWTSADAAGLPIFPGLARCDEVESGTISHALRFTVSDTQQAYVYPATHYASDITDPDYPPMGLRFRLKADYDTSGLTGQAAVIAEALKTYGMILADNGSNWFISGETNPGCWNDEELDQLKDIPGTAFEVIVSPDPAPVVLPAPSLYSPPNGAGTLVDGLTLGWNTVTSAVEYDIQLGQSDPPTTIVATVNSTEYTQYEPTQGFTEGQLYYWRVRARDGNATETDWSPVWSFMVASPEGAAPRRNLFLTSTPTLTWNRISWAVAYELQVDTDNLFVAADTYPAGNALMLTLPDSLVDGLYYWRVRAQEADGTWGAWSAADTFVVNG